MKLIKRTSSKRKPVAKKTAAKKVARKTLRKNPVEKTIKTTHKTPKPFAYVVFDNDEKKDIAQFQKKENAVLFAQNYADRWNRQVVVRTY